MKVVGFKGTLMRIQLRNFTYQVSFLCDYTFHLCVLVVPAHYCTLKGMLVALSAIIIA